MVSARGRGRGSGEGERPGPPVPPRSPQAPGTVGEPAFHWPRGVSCGCGFSAPALGCSRPPGEHTGGWGGATKPQGGEAAGQLLP